MLNKDTLKRLSVKKGDILQREGVLNSKVYKVVSGMLRSYTIDANGREIIFMFAPEGWIIGDYHGPEEPTELIIDAIEDSTVVVLPKDLVREQKYVAPLIKRMGVLQDRIMMLISTHAMERYEHFIRTYPDIAKRVPQKMIASYLGVTPETLSTVKKEWLKRTNS